MRVSPRETACRIREDYVQSELALSSIQLASEVSCPLHQLLVLLLFHLQFSLSLDTNGVHVATAALGLVKLELAEGQSLQKASGMVILHDSGAVSHDSDLTIGIGGLLDSEKGLVDAVLGNILHSLGLGHGAIRLGGSLGLRQRWGSEGQEFARHGVDLEVHAGLAAVGVLDIDLVHSLAHPLAFLLIADGHLGHGALELVDGIGKGAHSVGHSVGLCSGGENGRKVLI